MILNAIIVSSVAASESRALKFSALNSAKKASEQNARKNVKQSMERKRI